MMAGSKWNADHHAEMMRSAVPPVYVLASHDLGSNRVIPSEVEGPLNDLLVLLVILWTNSKLTQLCLHVSIVRVET